jgi:hypothetical protein
LAPQLAAQDKHRRRKRKVKRSTPRKLVDRSDSITAISAIARSIMRRYDDRAAFSHYFLWMTVDGPRGGKRDVLVGSGESSRADEVVAEVRRIRGVRAAWVNWD